MPRHIIRYRFEFEGREYVLRIGELFVNGEDEMMAKSFSDGILTVLINGSRKEFNASKIIIV